VILFLHHRYRTLGGEERAIEDLMWLVREHLGEETQLLMRESTGIGQRRAARGLLRGGLAPDDVGKAVRLTGATIVHAHNLHPTWGWRALASAREAGARVVLHLHNYRLVCAVGVCVDVNFEDCTRCHGANTLPGVRLNCRGSRPQAVVYAAALALHSRRMVAHADAVVVPSAFALERLRALGAPVGEARIVPHVIRSFATGSRADRGSYALIAARLVREKGLDIAIEACREAELPLVVAGDGPMQIAAEPGVRVVGRVNADELAELRAGAGLELVPSRMAESFGLSAAEAMAAGVPVVGSRIGHLAELLPDDALVAPGDVVALAAAAKQRFGDREAGAAGIERVRALTAPEVVAPVLRAVYDEVRAGDRSAPAVQ
jgi:glycosyltransferase involved in cell wall biosynthesis